MTGWPQRPWTQHGRTAGRGVEGRHLPDRGQGATSRRRGHIPTERSTGEIVDAQLEKVAERTGLPRQIMSDHGSDVKKGSNCSRSGTPTLWRPTTRLGQWPVSRIKAALEATPVKHVVQWCREHIPSSVQSQRRLAFAEPAPVNKS